MGESEREKLGFKKTNPLANEHEGCRNDKNESNNASGKGRKRKDKNIECDFGSAREKEGAIGRKWMYDASDKFEGMVRRAVE